MNALKQLTFSDVKNNIESLIVKSFEDYQTLIHDQIDELDDKSYRRLSDYFSTLLRDFAAKASWKMCRGEYDCDYEDVEERIYRLRLKHAHKYLVDQYGPIKIKYKKSYDFYSSMFYGYDVYLDDDNINNQDIRKTLEDKFIGIICNVLRLRDD